jgi:hypothetical protein
LKEKVKSLKQLKKKIEDNGPPVDIHPEELYGITVKTQNMSRS